MGFADYFFKKKDDDMEFTVINGEVIDRRQEIAERRQALERAKLEKLAQPKKTGSSIKDLFFKTKKIEDITHSMALDFVNGVIIDKSKPTSEIIKPDEVKQEKTCLIINKKTSSKPKFEMVSRSEMEDRIKIKAEIKAETKTIVKPVEKAKVVKHEEHEGLEEVREADWDVVEAQEIIKGRLPNIKRFWVYLQVTGRGERTIKEYQLEYRWWEKKAIAINRNVYLLNFNDIEQILRNIHPATVRRKTAMLKKLAKWYLREGKTRLHTEVSKLESPKMPKRLPGDLGADSFDYYRLLAREWCTFVKREGIWLGLMIMCGLRISEIQTVVCKNEFIQVIGKGNKERALPVPDWLLMAIGTCKRDGIGGWAKKRNYIWSSLAAEDIRHPHNLRHTFASECLRRGRSIVEVKALLGHENIATTDIYAKLQIPAGIAEVLDRDKDKKKK